MVTKYNDLYGLNEENEDNKDNFTTYTEEL